MHKLKNVLFAGFLVLVLTAMLMLPAAAEEAADPDIRTISISSMDEFLEFSKNCVRDIDSRDLIVDLKTDLDFTGSDYVAIPSFSGTFNGNRHTIKGIRLETEGSYQGLFRFLTDSAVVKDLTVLGEMLPSGSKNLVGGIAGSSAGLIKNCRFEGQAAGSESIGGIVGRNESGGVIENCTVSGSLKGAHFVGGIAGENLGVIRGCKNLSGINVNEEDNKIDSVSFNADFIMGKESVGTATDLGGIAGTSTGVIRDSVNHGKVGYPKMGYNLGGISGSQSGFIIGCKNYGSIQGRKEVAGITGQLEPVVEINYEEDTLQILRRQLDSTSSLANRASSNLHTGSQDLQGSINRLHSDADTAVKAIETLLPKDGKWPDEDVRIAAHNTLSSSIGSMQGSLRNINENAQSVVGNAAGDIQAINRSISEIARTLDNAAETLGGEIVDISDLDTEADVTGKIQDCHNYGSVSGDLNAGGIAGAVAWENDLDPENDFTVSGGRSLNFDSRLRAVIYKCSNSAKIEVSKKNAGGIAGSLSLGLVKECLNTGFIEGPGADYLGGIAGTSLGFIRNSNVKCKMTGHSYLGGIAGSASIVSGCRSTAMLEDGAEKMGSVIGLLEEDRTESEKPVFGNYYLPLSDHLGAVDGIDYFEQADSLSKEDFLSLPDLSSIFMNATMTFLYPDGSTQKITIPMGDVVPESKIPAPPRYPSFLGGAGILLSGTTSPMGMVIFWADPSG